MVYRSIEEQFEGMMLGYHSKDIHLVLELPENFRRCPPVNIHDTCLYAELSAAILITR